MWNDADKLAAARKAKRSGGQYLDFCPAHDNRDTRALIFWQGKTKIRVKCYAGCDALDVISAYRDLGVWPVDDASPEVKRRPRLVHSRSSASLNEVLPPAPGQAERDADEAARKARRVKYAGAIWREAVPIAGTPAERYVISRGLDPALLDQVARFHGSCPRGPVDRQAALVCIMRNVVSDIATGIHRTYLDTQDHKDGVPMMLGDCRDAAIKLTSHAATFCEEMGFCSRLHVSEGVESGVGAMMRGFRPLWALGNAGAVARFPVLFGVGALTVITDEDRAGEIAAVTALGRWLQAGREGGEAIVRHSFGERPIRAARAGLDFADPWKGAPSHERR